MFKNKCMSRVWDCVAEEGFCSFEVVGRKGAVSLLQVCGEDVNCSLDVLVCVYVCSKWVHVLCTAYSLVIVCRPSACSSQRRSVSIGMYVCMYACCSLDTLVSMSSRLFLDTVAQRQQAFTPLAPEFIMLSKQCLEFKGHVFAFHPWLFSGCMC